jgi:predicted DNA-binding transcriptional regulator YafY
VSARFEARLRRLLLLIPACARADRAGLAIDRAVALTGAASAAELRADVLSVQGVAVDDQPDASHLLVEVEGDRIRVDLDMGFGRPPPLSVREGAALLSALRPFLGTGVGAVESAARKIRRAIPDHVRDEVLVLAATTDLALPPASEWTVALEEAITGRLEVVVDYHTASSGAFARKVLEPRVLLPSDGRWYLIAFDAGRGAERVYRLDRIASLAVGTRCFGEHRGPALERSGRRHYRPSGQERPVVLRFAPEAARAARERWGAAAVEPAGADGRVTLTVTVTPNQHFLGEVLGWGAACEVVAPADVRDALRQRVESLRSRYA